MKRTIGKIGKAILPLILAFLPVICTGIGVQAQSPAPAPSIISISIDMRAPSEPPPSPSASPAAYFDAEVKIQVTGFNIVDKTGQPNVPGEGHIIYYNYIGYATIPTAPGVPALPPQGAMAAAYRSTNIPFLFVNNIPGAYTYAAQLVNNDDTPLVPPVLAVITTNQGAVTAVASGAPEPTSDSAGAVTLDLTASNLAFDKTSLSAPPGSQVTLTLDNQDAGVRHNFSVYTDSTADTAIFQGMQVNGPGTATYTFNAPVNPGEYYFRCDFHPQMNGTFIVSEDS